MLMYSLKRELKLNNKEVSLMRGCSGFKRWVYNWALKLVKASWQFKDIKASDTKRLDAAKKVFTNQVMHKPEYAWMKEYPSTIYQSAFQDLKGSLALGVISRVYCSWKAYRASLSAQYFEEAISKMGVFHTKCKRAH